MIKVVLWCLKGRGQGQGLVQQTVFSLLDTSTYWESCFLWNPLHKFLQFSNLCILLPMGICVLRRNKLWLITGEVSHICDWPYTRHSTFLISSVTCTRQGIELKKSHHVMFWFIGDNLLWRFFVYATNEHQLYHRPYVSR